MLERTRPALIGNLPIKVVAVEDLACRIASEGSIASDRSIGLKKFVKPFTEKKAA